MEAAVTRRHLFAAGLLLAGLTAVGSVTAAGARASSASATAFQPSAIRHVFVINLENKGFNETFGSGSVARYLNNTLRPRGQLLTQYYGVAHNSLPNYVA